MLERSSARYVILIYLGDMVLTIVALILARWLRIMLPIGKVLDAAGAALQWPIFVLVVIIWSVTLSALHVYDPHRFSHLKRDLTTTLAAITIATLVFAGVLYFSYRGLSRLLYGYFYILNLGLCLSLRLVLRALVRGDVARTPHGVLILGTGDAARRIAGALDEAAWMGLQMRGYLASEPHAELAIGEHPVLGTLAHAEDLVVQHAIREVIIALPMDQHHLVSELVSRLQALPVNIKVVPDYSDLAFYRNSIETIGDTVVIGLKEPVLGPIDRAIKRCFDVLASVVGLVVLSPLLAGIALAIKLGSNGPVIYRSRRIGENGEAFEMLKYRTMVPDADQHEAALVSEDTEGHLAFDKRQDDPRVTPLGRWLRRTSLDELPQLWNVLIGEMSLVGPRPELPSLVEHYQPWQHKRFGVPQGITGWWQISGRAKAKHLHVEDDLYYIRNYSLLLDLQILARTLSAVIRGDGAY